MIPLLVKIVRKEEWARDLIAGKLYANTVAFFKCIEDQDGRRDELEGAMMLELDGLQFHISATNPVTGETTTWNVPEEDFASPPVVQPNWFNHINVYCMYATRGLITQKPKEESESPQHIQIEITEECRKLGGYSVVIMNVDEFINRVRTAAVNKGYGLAYARVKYYDPEIGSPSVDTEIQTIFTKRKEFENQSEYRIAIDTRNNGLDALTLEIGDISDIAFLLEIGAQDDTN